MKTEKWKLWKYLPIYTIIVKTVASVFQIVFHFKGTLMQIWNFAVCSGSYENNTLEISYS